MSGTILLCDTNVTPQCMAIYRKIVGRNSSNPDSKVAFVSEGNPTQIGYKNGEEFEVFLKELGSENPISEKSLRTIHTQLKETHMLCVVMRGVNKLQPMVISLKSFNT